MGHGDQRRRRYGGDRRDPGNDVERYAGLGKRECLLAAPAEHERVAALEPHHVETGGAVGNEQPRHLLLRHPYAGDDERVVGCFVDEVG